jgi:protein-disulfide isomerase
MKALVTAGTMTLALLLAGCGDETGGGNTATAANVAPVPTIAAPNGGDWTQTVSATPEGGFLMGNPDAPVKLVEYASLTCPHCAEFSETAVPELTEKYIKAGQVSLEVRNFVRDPIDMTATLLSRCGGAQPYFKLTDQLFAAQSEWMQPFQQISEAESKRLSSLPVQQQFGELARTGGLVQFVKMRGIPESKANQCLADQSAVQKLVEMNGVAAKQHEIPGTPAFLINGELVENVANWEALEPKLREAIG